MMTAPMPPQNQVPPASSGYRAIDASTVATPAATVRRPFTGAASAVGRAAVRTRAPVAKGPSSLDTYRC